MSFHSHDGLFQVICISFGFMNLPVTFQLADDHTLDRPRAFCVGVPVRNPHSFEDPGSSHQTSVTNLDANEQLCCHRQVEKVWVPLKFNQLRATSHLHWTTGGIATYSRCYWQLEAPSEYIWTTITTLLVQCLPTFLYLPSLDSLQSWTQNLGRINLKIWRHSLMTV